MKEMEQNNETYTAEEIISLLNTLVDHRLLCQFHSSLQCHDGSWYYKLLFYGPVDDFMITIMDEVKKGEEE
ncbi:MAG: hypothetical protein J6S49_08760 [Erysipelotrichaceae bacterium]|nr:hypothetical protein [Erysipelotrichaceae bacterium]